MTFAALAPLFWAVGGLLAVVLFSREDPPRTQKTTPVPAAPLRHAA